VSYSPSAAGSLPSRADIVPGASTAGVGNLWFNPAAFTAPVNQFTFGNLARATLFGPGAVTIDVTGSKEFRFAERYTIQFRADFFNIPNHANFGNPAANISAPSSVGTITSAADPRQIQFGLKFLF
jgi:2',3'-cyclic-nucleotide 2'-phosphodiesterase (5'-nucleotidase family)